MGKKRMRKRYEAAFKARVALAALKETNPGAQVALVYKDDPFSKAVATATRKVAAEQPYIHRLTRLGAAAQIEGRSLAFARAISRVLWDGSITGWNEGDHLANAAAAAGFDLAAMDAAIAADPERYERVISGNEQDHAASGHWGVPTFVFENEPFFGQDRIDLLVWRMESKGLSRRDK